MKKFLLLCSTFLGTFLLIAPSALADTLDPHTPGQFVLPAAQLYVLVIGMLVPLVTYGLNHIGPWVTEQVKGIVLVITAAIAAGLYQALDSVGSIGFNSTTLQLVATSVVAAFGAHHWLWKPSGISTSLGAGSNR